MEKNCVKLKNILDIFSLDFTLKSRDDFLESLKFVYNELYHKEQNKYNMVLPEGSRLREAFQKVFNEFLINQVIENETMNVMLYFLYSVMNSLLDGYHKFKNIKSYILYRGGNVLKIYKDEFEEQISKDKRKLLSKYFDEYFASSDLDFMIMVEDKEKDKKSLSKFRKEIQALCHYGLSVSRDLLLISRIYPFCNYNDEELKETFLNLFDGLDKEKQKNENPFVKESEYVAIGLNKVWYYRDTVPNYLDFSEQYPNYNPKQFYNNQKTTNTIFHSDLIREANHSGELDFISEKKENYPKKIYCDYLTDLNFFKDSFYNKVQLELLDYLNDLHYMYITGSTSISSTVQKTHFRLSRLLMNFSVVYKNNDKYGLFNSFGEVYDLSIIEPDDIMYDIYNKDNIYEKEVKVKYGGKDKSLKIYIPKLRLAIEDLARILFGNNRFPWSSDKYEKRVYRLYLLLFVFSIKKEGMKKTITKIKEMKLEGEDEFDILYMRKKLEEIRKYKLSDENVVEMSEFEKLLNETEGKLLEVFD